MYLLVSLLSYPNSLGLIEIAICVSATVIFAIFTFALALLVGWLIERFPKFEVLGECIVRVLGSVFPYILPLWVGPSLLYPLLGKIIRGSIGLEFWPLLVALGVILSIISSIITIYEFLIKKLRDYT